MTRPLLALAALTACASAAWLVWHRWESERWIDGRCRSVGRVG